MNRMGHLAVFAKIANGALHAFHVRTLEQPEEHRAGFALWCFKTQFARVFEAGDNARRRGPQ